MIEYLKNIRNIDVYRTQQQGYGHPLTIIMSKKMRKEARPHGENPPSIKEKEKYEKHVFIIYLSSLE